ncbi:MAG: hypothetical protein JO010_15115 [Alphaproteobacteria bacterium]|nr:hypothetical protein [Alphaproteobacteria bacterium]
MSALVAASDLIVIATPEVDRERLAAAATSSDPDYLKIRLASVRLLKGDLPSGDLVLRFFPRDRPYAPSNAALAAASNVPSILFLTHVDAGPVGNYFAGYSQAALQVADPSRVDAIVSEIARQRQILDSWRPDPTIPYDREVSRLIRLLTSLGRDPRSSEERRAVQEDVFRRIEALGAPAVPAIIAHMDDRTPLAFDEISLVNHAPDAFESTRHYGPQWVVDALDAILNQITGRSFGNIMNGGSERERRAAVSGWRIYAANLRCGGSP